MGKNARTFGQDLMRGEHVVGQGNGTAAGATFGALPSYDGAQREQITGTSIFDPVLCELAYRWFCPPSGSILDPFAGGSVRGIVASKLGFAYTGVDLRAEQIDANRAQAKAICSEGDAAPRWVCGDSREVLPALALQDAGIGFDFVFSCPPYADLEVYSDDPRDISTLEYAEFRAAYVDIIAGACALLKNDRFACFVIGDVRDKKGFYRNLPGHTIDAFEAAGLRLYNDAILVTAAGSLPIRAGKQFSATRKLGSTHQRVLVFCKGDPRVATGLIGEVEFGEIVADVEGEEAAAPLAESDPAAMPGVEEL